MTLHLLSAGAAQGLARAIEPGFSQQHGTSISAQFGAVGAIKALFDGGAPCDVLVLTAAMIDALAAAGALQPATRAALGRVRTGIAVREGTTAPDVTTPEALRAALLAADAIHFPDAEKSTAGIHFAKVMRELGVADALRDRLRTYPNGATAMRALAADTSAHPIGCTQHTEILYTPGVHLVAALPARFELATVYTAAVAARSAQPEHAAALVAALAGPGAAALRAAGGFEPDA